MASAAWMSSVTELATRLEYQASCCFSSWVGFCRICKAEEGAPANICMNEEDLKIFLPMSAEALASDSQENGVAQVTVNGGAK